ncbi:MAG: hypothetical protein J6O49_11050 [Bacteroidaceae bacterium]|nr:hypothetical protein [Bacteroidaceae bacterium]
MGIYQQGKVPKEQKSIFPEGAKVERIIFHDMAVVGGELVVNADDREEFRAECAKREKLINKE